MIKKYGVDYAETFSPVVRFESVDAIMALASKHDLKLHQMDASSAFLNGKLDEKVCMVQPENYIKN